MTRFILRAQAVAQTTSVNPRNFPVKTDFQPVAIIGIGCRFPGGCDSPSSFWRLLKSGDEAISETPPDRWDLERFYRSGKTLPGKTQSRWGGYIDGLDRFDPDPFGISPREAAAMDPQQRLLLETAYRATEDAGVPLASLAGQSVSVHVGISSIDYAVASLSFEDRGVIGPYSNTGGSSSIAANRISYCLDLRGESVAVDTACSSSLIATHLACRSLQDPRNKMALAGGVNALLLPDFFVAFSQLGVLSPDGRCKTFDASANGYVRGEGAAMLLLKRLDDAVADGDSIYAVIRGTSTNQDGRTDGMTVPSQRAQTELIDAALQTAGLSGREVSYVEAHGTGTSVGDPIEAAALAKAYGRCEGPACFVGSVKTNIGHLEAGAGVASLVKVALAIKHHTIPPHLNLETLNPKIDFASANLDVPKSITPWNPEGPRLAGINGFGYGGANAHLILSEPPKSSAPASSTLRVGPHKEADAAVMLPLSASSKPALALTAARWADWLRGLDSADHSFSLDQIANTATRRRSHLDQRAAVVGHDRQQWAEQLEQLSEELADRPAAEDEASATMIRGRRKHGKAIDRLAMVCCGQGPQWWGMGRRLFAADATFRETIERCDSEFKEHADWSLIDELFKDEHRSRMHLTAIAQPSLFALQVSLAGAWKNRGVVPTVLVGHSVGEIAAAHLSGALDFEDACCVAVHRGRTMDSASSAGAMIAVGISNEDAKRRIEPYRNQVSIAAINGPSSLTLSGEATIIEELQHRFDDEGIFCRRLQVEYAFHSPQMDPVRDALLESLSEIQTRSTHTTLISTVTGQISRGLELDGQYWWKNVRHGVRFADAMNVLADLDVPLAIELGPHPVLAYAMAECFSDTGKSIDSYASLHRDAQDDVQMAQSLGELYCSGLTLCPESSTSLTYGQMCLPPMAMNRRALWSESRQSRTTRLAINSDPVLGDRIDSPTPAWQCRLDLKEQTSLADHRVRQVCMLPAAAMLQHIFSAADQLTDLTCISVRDFRLTNPCLLDSETPVWLRTSFNADRRRISLSSRDVDGSEWMPLAATELSSSTAVRQKNPAKEITSREQFDSIEVERIYRHCKSIGLNYGPSFRRIVSAHRHPAESVVKVRRDGDVDPDRFGISPAILDSCFHGMIVADPDFEQPFQGLYLPNGIDSFDLYEPLTDSVTAHVRLVEKNAQRMIADIDLYTAAGVHCAAIRGFESLVVTGTRTTDSAEQLLYRCVWKPSERIDESAKPFVKRKWLVFADQSGIAVTVAKGLPGTDGVITLQHGTSFKRLHSRSFIIDPENLEHFDRVLQDCGDGITDIVYLWGLDTPDNVELSQDVLQKSSTLTTQAPLNLAKAWQAACDSGIQSETARLAIVTLDAQPPDDEMIPLQVAAGPLIGLGRVMISECGRLDTRLVDLTSTDESVERNLLQELIHCTDDEDEILYRDAIRWVRRFVPSGDEPIHPESGRQIACRLQRGSAASLDQLRYETVAKMGLAPREVEIEVLATGLNFSDVMKSLNLYPGETGSSPKMGAECSGRVTRIGTDVTDYSVGDEVVAIAKGAFATRVTVDQTLVAQKPSQLTHNQAAAIPIAYLTAHHALNQCARIQSGDRVLIHSATGGVGLAAIELAKLAGATVYATAGTEVKREHLRSLGLGGVMDSRTLEFARQTLDLTEGEGVDAVLNSLPGEAISKGLSVLRTGGRFLEIGKRDIYSDASIGLEPFKNNLALFAIDLDQLFTEQPESMGKMLRDLMKRFEIGELSAPPTTVFPADETQDAFRFMQQAKHIGKVVVDYRTGVKRIFAGQREPVTLRHDRTYWVPGGLGGFGLRLAQWLIEKGAKHLVLGGRSPSIKESTREVLDDWAEQGIDISIVPVDLTDIRSVRDVVAEIDRHGPPLAGVFHTAMVLEDRLMVDLDLPTLHRVLGPKVLGGWNLHTATADHDLDHFVLFSSLSSVFGHAGQANYSAANAFLDSLAHYRRAIGMPGLTINWGHVGEVGYLAQRNELSQRLERQGVLTFSPDEAMQCLEDSFATGAIQQSVLRMDWTRWRGLGITGSVSPRFGHLLRGRPEEGDAAHQDLSADDIRNADSEDRPALVGSIVGRKAADLMGIEFEAMDWDQPLLSMGLDSLMAVEMRNWIEGRLEIDLPIASLMQTDGLHHLSSSIAELVAQTTLTEVQTDADELLDELPVMSDERVDELLTQMLQQSQSEQLGG